MIFVVAVIFSNYKLQIRRLHSSSYELSSPYDVLRYIQLKSMCTFLPFDISLFGMNIVKFIKTSRIGEPKASLLSTWLQKEPFYR